MAGTLRAAGFQPFALSWNKQQAPIMDASYDNAPADSSNSAASQNLSALGTLIGYIGAEAATVHLFERLLWPQRFWNHLTLRNAALIAIFMPMGGPLHKAALQTLDEFFAHGLFKGDRQGHMLGTAFFRDTKLGYTVWTDGEAGEKEFVRNGLWIRAIAQMDMPNPKEDKSVEAATAPKRPLRAKTSLSLLVLENSAEAETQRRPVVEDDTGPPSPLVYACIFISELTGVAMGAIVACLWKSWIAVLWFMPLILKLLSTFWAISREDLVAPATTLPGEKAASEPTKMFEIHHPHHGLFVIKGKESVVLQFFRHYGHPTRNRFREVFQFAMIVCLGLVFPAGLVISVMCMSDQMQYLWFGYQLYTTFTMHMYRYANTHSWGTTEQAIAAEFDECRRQGQPEVVDLRGGKNYAVTAKLSTTYYNNLKDAQEAAVVLLTGPLQSSDSDVIAIGDDDSENGDRGN